MSDLYVVNSENDSSINKYNNPKSISGIRSKKFNSVKNKNTYKNYDESK